jgi:hypothetical protein
MYRNVSQLINSLFFLLSSVLSVTFGSIGCHGNMCDDFRRPCCCLCRHIAVAIAMCDVIVLPPYCRNQWCMTSSDFLRLSLRMLSLWRHTFLACIPYPTETIDVITPKQNSTARRIFPGGNESTTRGLWQKNTAERQPQAAGWSCCGWSCSSLFQLGFQLDSLHVLKQLNIRRENFHLRKI